MSYFNTMCVPLRHCSMKKVSWRKPPKAKSSRSWRSTLVKTVPKHHRHLIQQRLGTSLMLWQTFARSNRRLVVTLVNFAIHSCVSFSRQQRVLHEWLCVWFIHGQVYQGLWALTTGEENIPHRGSWCTEGNAYSSGNGQILAINQKQSEAWIPPPPKGFSIQLEWTNTWCRRQ